MAAKRALVTGSGGFIGSHLVEKLVEEGYEVRAFLRYNSRSDRGFLSQLPEEVQQHIEIFWGDLRDAEAVRRAVSGIHSVFHLGALIAIPYSYVNPADYVQTNMLGTAHVLDAARDSDALDRVVVTSTSEVYGTAQYVPIDENHPKQGQSPYSASKIGADHLAESYHRSFDLPVAIMRPFNTYGPRQSMRAIIPTIIVQMLQRDVVELGSLTPRRDLNYVKDTAKGFVEMMEAESIPYGDPINIGSGKDISIGELAEMIRELIGSKAEIVCRDERVRPEKSEVNRLLADVKKAREAFGWEPAYSLREGLKETIAWFEPRLQGYDGSRYYV